jgi:hypothetical protein
MRAFLSLPGGVITKCSQLVAEPYGTRLSSFIGASDLIGLSTHAALCGSLGDKLFGAADQAFLQQIFVLGAKVDLGFGRGVPAPVPVKLARRRAKNGK